MHTFCFSYQLRCLLSPTQGLWFGYRPLPMGFPGGSDCKESACNPGDLGSIPGFGRSPGEGNYYPLQYFLPGESHGQRSLVGYSPSMCVCVVTQSCLVLCNLMDCSPLGSSVHGDSPARILEWIAMPSSRGSSKPRD